MNRKHQLTTLLIGSVMILTSLAFSGPAVAQSPSSGWMDAMHDSPGMVEMHEQMSSGGKANCDQMHERMSGQMSEWMQQHVEQMPSDMGGMMDGSGGMMSY